MVKPTMVLAVLALSADVPATVAAAEAPAAVEANQQRYTVYLWKLTFEGKKDDVLAKMAAKDGKVGGFWVQ